MLTRDRHGRPVDTVRGKVVVKVGPALSELCRSFRMWHVRYHHMFMILQVCLGHRLLHVVCWVLLVGQLHYLCWGPQIACTCSYTS